MTHARAVALIGRYPIIICVTIVMHFVWSISVGIDPGAVHATALHTVMTVAGNPAVAALIFGSVAMVAALGLTMRDRYVRVFFILPQQIVLWFSIVGAGHAMWLGQFADGVQRSNWFLIVDQIPVVLIALGHTAALLLIAENGRGD